MLAVFELWWIFFFGSLSNKYSTLRSQSRPRRFPFNNCGPIFDGNETDWKTTVNKSKQTHRPSWTLRISFGGRKFQSCERARNATSINFLRFPFGNVYFFLVALPLWGRRTRRTWKKAAYFKYLRFFSSTKSVCSRVWSGIECEERKRDQLLWKRGQ